MRTFNDVPEVVRKGVLKVNGHEIMAFLADPREDGATYVADDIFDAFGNGDDRKRPSNYVAANRAYLNELAQVSGCGVANLIGLRKDGRYWCIHQVAVNYAAWLDKRVQVLLERSAIAFAKEAICKCYEWIDKRSVASQAVVMFNAVVDEEIDIPPGKEKGFKYAVMNSAVQDPLNKAMGEPEKTRALKEKNKVLSAMDAYDTPWVAAATMVRSVAASNIKRKKLRALRDASAETRSISTKTGEFVKGLLSE